MYLSVDRLEDDYAVCEDDRGNITEINLKLLPEGIKESDVISFYDGKYHIEKEESEKRKKFNMNMQKKL